MKRPAETGMRLWQQRSSKATILPSPVRHSTSGFSAMTWPLSWPDGNSGDRPATYQAFLTSTLAIMGAPPRVSDMISRPWRVSIVFAGGGRRLCHRPLASTPTAGGKGRKFAQNAAPEQQDAGDEDRALDEIDPFVERRQRVRHHDHKEGTEARPPECAGAAEQRHQDDRAR